MLPVACRILSLLVLAVGCAADPEQSEGERQETTAEAYDVIIIGAGVSGSVTAARLSQSLPSSSRMLILEGGGPISAPEADPPGVNSAEWGAWQWQPWPLPAGAQLSKFDVPGNYNFLPCYGGGCDEMWESTRPAFQCKILGGCGSMNGELTMVPPESDFSESRGWPAAWQWKDVGPAFNRLLQVFNTTCTPSVDGRHYLDEHGGAQFRAAMESAGLQEMRMAPPTPVQEGVFGVPAVIAEEGLRQSPATKLLPKALSRPSTELRLRAEVTQLVHDGDRVSAVRYRHTGNPQEITVALNAQGIVVLTAGALNTPRLLLQSGVGPASEVAGRSRTPVINEYVGRSLSDHPIVPVTFKMPASANVTGFSYKPPNTATIQKFLDSRTGELTQYGPLLTAYFQDRRHSDEFDVEAFVNPSDVDNEVKVWFMLMRPQCSNATIRLTDTGNVDWSEWHKLFLPCSVDQEIVQNAVSAVERAMSSRFGAARVPSDLAAYPSNHYVGTCALGTCVDPNTLRVHGLSNAHVADASLIPRQVTGHPWLTVAAVAEHAARKIVSSRAAPRLLRGAPQVSELLV